MNCNLPSTNLSKILVMIVLASVSIIVVIVVTIRKKSNYSVLCSEYFMGVR